MTIQADTIMTGDLYAQPLSESVPARSADQMVSAEAVVRYRVSDPVDWVILGGRGRRLLAQAARSVIREQIGYMTLDDAVGPKRSRLARHCTSHLRLTIDSLDLGAEVLDVGLVRVAPDEGTDELRVDEAFDAAEQASADHAEIVASARAEAERITSQARAGAALRVSAAQQREEQQIAAARAEAERFQALQEAFRNDPEGVKHALLLDLIGQRLQRGRVVVIDTDPDVPASQPASRPAAEGAAR